MPLFSRKSHRLVFPKGKPRIGLFIFMSSGSKPQGKLTSYICIKILASNHNAFEFAKFETLA